MSSSNFHLDGNSRAPEVSLFNHDWADWVGLNADTEKIPPGARDQRDPTTIDWDTMEVTPSGRYVEMEWTVHPDWYHHNTHWRGYGPTRMTTTSSIGSPWYLDMDSPVAYCAVEGGYSFAEHQRGNVSNDLAFFDNCLEEVKATKQFVNDSPVPPPYDSARLETTFRSVIALQREGAAAKRATWDRLAFLAWWTASCSDWADGVDEVMAERVEGIIARGRNPRGFLFDLLKDWNEMNVPFLLERSIPFYYIFSLEARLTERFCRLNPKILASYTGPDGDEVVIHDIDYEDDLGMAEAATHRYDDFFQLLRPDVMNDHMSYESDSSFFIVDFEGWGRRPIISDRECRCYSVLFRFTVTGDVDGAPQVVFWRFRPKHPLELQQAHPLWHPWSDDPILIRERFKGVFAPTSTCRFHTELGTLLPSSQGALPDHQLPLISKPPSLMSRLSTATSSRSLPDDKVSTGGAPTLLIRMSHPDHSSKKLHVRQVSRLESLESDSHDTSRSRSSQSRQCSRSPRSPYGRLPADPAESFKLALADSVARFTWKEKPEKVALFADFDRRKNLVFQHAFLCVSNWRSQVRMRYYASCRPEVSGIQQVVDIAVVHRLEFALAIRVSETDLFAPDTISGLDRIGIKALYQPGFTEPFFSYTKGTPAVFANAYLAKINDILRRPHARAFIGMGGPYSWIAERFGGPSIVKAFLSGPSIQVTRHLLGRSDSHEENPIGLQWDQVSAQEGSFLFGFVPSQDSVSPERYLFPPLTTYENYATTGTGIGTKSWTRFLHESPMTLNGAKPNLANTAGGVVIYGITTGCLSPPILSSRTQTWRTRKVLYGVQAYPERGTVCF